jgi:hypothetical protein
MQFVLLFLEVQLKHCLNYLYKITGSVAKTIEERMIEFRLSRALVSDSFCGRASNSTEVEIDILVRSPDLMPRYCWGNLPRD